MTICIAGLTLDANNHPNIIACCDTLASSSLGKAENAHKIRPMAGDWALMQSGSEPDMTSVANLICGNFRSADVSNKNFDEDAALVLVRSALQTRKLQKADEIIIAKYGIGYDELRKTGASQFPADIYREAIWAVGEGAVEADFIIFGFTGLGMATIIQSSGTKAHITEPFATIGSGSYLAHSVLMHRGFHEFLSLDEALYVISEAKKYAEGEPHVGQHTVFMSAHQNGRRYVLSNVGRQWTKQNYERFGPKSLEGAEFKTPDASWDELSSAAKNNRAKND